MYDTVIWARGTESLTILAFIASCFKFKCEDAPKWLETRPHVAGYIGSRLGNHPYIRRAPSRKPVGSKGAVR